MSILAYCELTEQFTVGYAAVDHEARYIAIHGHHQGSKIRIPKSAPLT